MSFLSFNAGRAAAGWLAEVISAAPATEGRSEAQRSGDKARASWRPAPPNACEVREDSIRASVGVLVSGLQTRVTKCILYNV